MIIVYGSKGNMGRRYCAILRALGVKWWGVDLDADHRAIPHDKAAGYIVATPTTSHIRMIRALLPRRKPILCEKPWSTDIQEFRELMVDLKPEDKSRLSMVAQYRQLLPSLKNRGHSFYDYYKHGGDGLVWDCVQIIGLSNGPVSIREESPIWRCKINGHTLSLGDMDKAYIKDIQDWLSGQRLSVGFISDAHEKTHQKDLEVRRG